MGGILPTEPKVQARELDPKLHSLHTTLAKGFFCFLPPSAASKASQNPVLKSYENRQNTQREKTAETALSLERT